MFNIIKIDFDNLRSISYKKKSITYDNMDLTFPNSISYEYNRTVEVLTHPRTWASMQSVGSFDWNISYIYRYYDTNNLRVSKSNKRNYYFAYDDKYHLKEIIEKFKLSNIIDNGIYSYLVEMDRRSKIEFIMS